MKTEEEEVFIEENRVLEDWEAIGRWVVLMAVLAGSVFLTIGYFS